MFTFTIQLFSSFFSPMSDYIISLIGLGLVCACPFLVRRIIDYV